MVFGEIIIGEYSEIMLSTIVSGFLKCFKLDDLL